MNENQVRKLRHDDDWSKACLELMPMLEEILCRGTLEQKHEFAAYLAERAEDLRLLAGTNGFGNIEIDAQHLDPRRENPKVWRQMEAVDKLSDTLLMWNQSVIYAYWSRMILRSPTGVLRKMVGW